MNHIYRLIWNSNLNTWTVVPEIAKTHGKRSSGKTKGLLLAMGGLLYGGQAFALDPGALPTGGQINSGAGHISQIGNQMTIQQNTPRMSADWQSFNIGQQAHVQFQQPSTSSVALNRVVGQNASEIQGKLDANGQVYLVNSSGIVFGKTAQVNVGGLVASTHQLSDADFSAGKNKFTSTGSDGKVVNQGQINAKDGVVALIANKVDNEGTITAGKGDVVLAAGKKVELDFDGDGLIKLEVDGAAVNTQVHNKGLIQADGAVIMTAKAADQLVGSVVNNSGIVEAKAMQHKNGRIVLDGGDVSNSGQLSANSNTNSAQIEIKADKTISHTGTATVTGNAKQSGKILVDSGDAGSSKIDGGLIANNRAGKGGAVTVLGKDIQLAEHANIEAKGKTGGGNVLVGGDWQGSGDLHQATTVDMHKAASIDASAIRKGDGGKVVLWSDTHKADSVTSAKGSIKATGGALGGNGGKVETSGHKLQIDDIAVNTTAPKGQTGDWLLDPYNISIGTSNDSSISQNSGTYTSTGDNSTLHINTINSALNSNNVTIQTGSGGTQGGDIFWNQDYTYSGGSARTLTLSAHRDITLNGFIKSSNGALSTTFSADSDSDGYGGVVVKNDIDTHGGNFTVNGLGAIFASGSARSVSTSGGSFIINGEMIIANNAGLTINTGNGLVNVTGSINSGNSYAYDSTGRTYDAAKSTYGSTSLSVGSQYLVTITSALESTAVAGAAGTNEAWAGGDDKSNDGTWRWTTGPEGAENGGLGRVFWNSGSATQNTTGYVGANGQYVNWNSGEPNGGTTENALQIGFSNAKLWNDLRNNDFFTQRGSIVETNLAASPLTINAGTGTVNFGGDVGVQKAIGDLQVTGSALSVHGTVLTEASQTYNAPIAMTGADVTLRTRGPAASGYDVLINNGVTKLSGGDATLTVRAHRDIYVNSDITATNGKLNLLIEADYEDIAASQAVTHDGAGFIQLNKNITTNGGTLQFGSDSTVTLGGVNMKVGGDIYVAGNTAQLFSTGNGNITINGETIIANTNGLTVNSGNGDVVFDGVVNSGNSYTGVTSNGTWSAAKTAAQTGTGLNTGDTYLATITSRLENSIASRANSYNPGWLGGRRVTGIGTNLSWRWVTGPEAAMDSGNGLVFFNQNSVSSPAINAQNGTAVGGNFNNWNNNEPNNWNGSATAADNTEYESILQFTGNLGRWNDLPGGPIPNSSASTQSTYVRESNLAASPLTVNAGTGSVTVNGGIGGGKALASLIVNANTIDVNGNALITTGTQTFNHALTVTSAGDLQVGASLLSDTLNDGAVTFKATGNITTNLSTDIQTNNGAITFWADSDANQSGYINIMGTAGNSSTITSNGGAITLGGGAGTTVPTGSAYGGGSTMTGGINVELASLSAGAGDISLRGVSKRSAADYGIGTRFMHASMTGNNITVSGTGSTGNNAYSSNWGIGLEDTTIIGSGAISLTGAGGNAISSNQGINQFGIYIAENLNSDSSISATGTGTITLNGSGGGLAGGNGTLGQNEHGVYIAANQANPLSTAGGAITITGASGYGSTSNGVQIDSPITTAGSLNIISNLGTGSAGTGNIAINSNLKTTNANAGILAKAAGNIVQAANIAIQTNAGNVTYWADSDRDNSGNGSGGIRISNGGSIDTRTAAARTAAAFDGTGGGLITLAGGLDDGGTAAGISGRTANDGLPDGFAVNSGTTVGASSGVLLGNDTALAQDTNITLYSGGGDITINGKSTSSSNGLSLAIETYQGYTIDAGSNGNISMVGAATGSSIASSGFDLASFRVNGNNNAQSIIRTRGTGSITLTGSGSGGSAENIGIAIDGDDTDRVSIEALGTGSVTLTGNATGTLASAIRFGASDILAASGDISLLASAGRIWSTGQPNYLGYKAGSNVTSTTSNILLRADTLTAASALNANTSGTLTVEPASTSFSSALSWPISNVALGSTLGGLTIGKQGNTANITITAPQTVAGSINIYGGNISLNSSLTSTASGASGAAILAKASGDIIANSLITNGGNITLWSDSDGSGQGGIQIKNNAAIDSRTNSDRTATTNTSGGGRIIMAGGLDDGGTAASLTGLTASDDLPDGYAINHGSVTGSNVGLMLGNDVTVEQNTGITVRSGGGNITMRGKATSSTRNSHGIQGFQGYQINAGTAGNITMVGFANTTGAFTADAMDLFADRTSLTNTGSSAITTQDGNIALTGSSTGSSSLTIGVGLEGDGVDRMVVQATGTGSISITGSAANSSNQNGLRLQGTDILAATGDINLIAPVGPINVLSPGAYIGKKAATSVTSSGSTILLRADNVALTSALNVDSAGILTVEPYAASFSSAFTDANYNLSNLLVLTLGKVGNTASMTINNPQTIAGPISIYGGNIAINNVLTSTGNNTITLSGSGAVTDGASGYVIADKLLLLGSGTVTLDNVLNNINILAAGTSQARVGNLYYLDSNALSIGNVNSHAGIFGSGTVSIATNSNDLNLDQNINTTNSSTSAITLNAGKSTTAGTSSGGNIVISNLPSLTTGVGGRATLYSGSLSENSLALLIGPGSGRFRYNSDEAVSNFTSLLGAGNYGIYREQPTLTVTAATPSFITYGQQPVLSNSVTAGLINGDTASNALSTSATVTVGAVRNGNGYFNANADTDGSNASPYTLTASGGVSGVGYALQYATGSLTIGKKVLTVTANDDAKFVNLADNSPNYNDVSYSGFVSGESSSALTGSAAVARSSSGPNGNLLGSNELEGAYTGVLSPVLTGLSSGNYSFNPVNGNYTIVPVDTLLIRSSNVSTTYGDAPTYLVSTVSYLSSGNLVTPIVLSTVSGTDSANGFIRTDGTSSAGFTLTSGSSAGSHSITAASYTVTGTVSALNANTPVVIGALTVLPRTVNLSAIKNYDGSDSLTGAVTIGNLAGSETLNYTNAFTNDQNVAAVNKYVRAITLTDGSNGGLASNYQLPNLTSYSNGVNSVTIDPKALTISASKTYDSTTDVTDYVSLTGLVAGESLAVTNASANNSHVATAGKYIDSLTLADASGLVSNYSLPGATTPSTGIASTFGNNTGNSVTIATKTLAASLTNTGVTKVYDGNTAAPGGGLASGNGSFTPTWLVTGFVGSDTNATFSYSNALYDFATVASASKVTVSGLAVSGITGGAGLSSDYVLDASSKDVTAAITARPVQVSGSNSGLSKVYDGDTTMQGVTVSLAGINGNANSGEVSGDNLTVSGTGGSFSTSNAGSGKTYTLTGLQLSGGMAGNYSIFGANGSSLQGNDGVIYKRPLAITFTGINKDYDGNTGATVNTTYANNSYAPVLNDDVTVVHTAAFADKNVNTGKTVNISGVSLTGTAAGNYAITYSGSNPLHSPTVGSNAGYNTSTTADIARLNSVTWIGGASGNWFDPANWAGGAVPDLANVANVIIPNNVTVDFGSTIVAPAQSGAVQIDSLGASGGGLNMAAGQLDVGSGGINLGSINQTGGALTSTGAITVDNFSQSAGTLSASDNLTVQQSFDQTGAGSINVTGNTLITDNSGGTTLGNLTTHGSLSVVSTGGDIAQSNGTVLNALGDSSFNAGTNNVILANAGNNFVGPVSVVANDATLKDDTGGIILGTIVTNGALGITSTDANISQALGGSITSNGTTTLDAGTFDVLLGNDGNNFVGPVAVIADDATLKDDIGGIVLGDVTTTGVLGVTSTGGNISQSNGTTIQSNGSTALDAGTNDIILGNNGNNFVGPVAVIADDATLKDDIGGIILGDVATTGVLDVTSTNGNISQSNGTTIQSNGTTNLDAGTFDVVLGNNGNNFVGPVAVIADDATLKDDIGGIILGDVTTTGVLDVTSTGGNISQANGTAIQSSGSTALDAGTNDVILGNNGNNFVGPVAVIADDATLKDDIGGIILGDVTSTGVLDVTSTNGNISQANGTTIQSSGSTVLDAGTNDVILGNNGNNFVGPVAVIADDATLKDDIGGIILGDVTTTGALDVTSTNGNISQANGTTIQSSGSTALDAGTNDVILGNNGNNFVGPVAVIADDATLKDSTGGIILGDVITTGVLDVTSTAGNISQGNGTTIQSSGSTALDAGTNDVILGNNGNNFVGPVAVIADDATLKDDIGGIILGDVITTGVLDVTSTGGNISQANGTTIQSSGSTALDAGTNDVILGNNGNNFVGPVAVIADDATLKDSTGGIILGDVTTTGVLGVTSTGGNISQANGTTIQSSGSTALDAGTNDVILGNNGNNFVGPVSILADDATLKDATGGIILGDVTTSGALDIISTNGNISQANGSSIQSNGSTTLNAGTNDVILANNGNNFVGPVAVIADDAALKDDIGGIVLGNVTTTGVLGITSTNGNISQSNGTAINSNGPTALDAGTNDVILGNNGNNFVGPVSILADDATLKDATGGIILGDVTTTGVLGVTSTGGNISQANGTTIQSNGSTALDAGTNDVILANNGNNFVGPVAVIADDATLKDATGGIILGDVTTTGVLGVTSTGGNISQANGTAINSNGSTALNAGTNDVILANNGNNFVGPVNVIADDATLKDNTGGIILGDVTTTGVLGVISTNGNISQANGTTIQSNGSTALNAGTNDVILGNNGNNFVGPVSILADDATLKDATGGIILGDVTTTGVLGITSTNGNISQAIGSVINSNGTTDLNAGSNNISLNGNNNFVGPLSASANDISIADNQGGIVLGNINSTGSFNANSAGGSISQATNTALTIAGIASLSATTGNPPVPADILLGNAGNDFQGLVSSTGNNVTLADINDLNLGSVTSAANLAVNAGGNLDLGNANVAGNVVAQSGNGNLSFDNLNAGGNTNLKTLNGNVTLGNLTSMGNLNINAKGGNIGQTVGSVVNVGGVTNLLAEKDGSPANIILAENNDFTGTVNANGGLVTLTDVKGGLVLGNISSTKGLTATSTGGAISQKAGSSIIDDGITTLSASNGGKPADISLDSSSNDLTQVNATGKHVIIADKNGFTQGQIDAESFQAPYGSNTQEVNLADDIRSSIIVAPSATVGSSAPSNTGNNSSAASTAAVAAGSGSATISAQQQELIVVNTPTISGMSLGLNQGSVAIQMLQTDHGFELRLPETFNDLTSNGAVKLVVVNLNKQSSMYTLTDNGNTLSITDAQEMTDNKTPPSNGAEDKSSSATLSIENSSPVSLSVSLTKDGVLKIHAPSEIPSTLTQQQLILLGVAMAKQNLHVNALDLKGIVLE